MYLNILMPIYGELSIQKNMFFLCFWIYDLIGIIITVYMYVYVSEWV